MNASNPELIVNGVYLGELFTMSPTVVIPSLQEGGFLPDCSDEYKFRGASLGPIALNIIQGRDWINPTRFPMLSQMHAGSYFDACAFAAGLVNDPFNLQYRPRHAEALAQLLPRERRSELPQLFPAIVLGVPDSHPKIRPADAPGAYYFRGKVSFKDIDPLSRDYLEDLFQISLATHFAK